MTTPAVREHQSPLESALLDVYATLSELLVAADEQHAALVAHDSTRLESVTRQQERLSARLARAEARRTEATGQAPLAAALAAEPRESFNRAQALTDEIAGAIQELQQKHAHTTNLLEQSMQVTGHTLAFLQRLVTSPSPAYGAHGVIGSRQSVLVDRRA